jgi:spore germination protein KC
MTLLILLNAILASGCWNYREVDKLAIVAGAAIDKGENGLYTITVEIVKIGTGKETKSSSEMITMEGKTIFDAVRNGILSSKKRFYWSHAKVVILSKEIASEGVIKVLDWFNRDSEARPDIRILISKEASAKEIFTSQGTTEEIKSFLLDDSIKNQMSLSKAPINDNFQFVSDLQAEGLSAITPSVTLKQIDGKMFPHITGAAIFKSDKLIGFLNDEETKDLLFIRNMVKGGILTEGTQENGITTPVSLEIFNSKTQVKPVVDGMNIEIHLNIDTTVAIDEIGGTENLIDDEGRLRLEQNAEKSLKKQIESLIKKVQSEYAVDIFGFGAKLREDKNDVWKDVSSNWEEKFRNLEVNVTIKVHIRNSAVLSKPLKESD